jgi:hypothetical protein
MMPESASSSSTPVAAVPTADTSPAPGSSVPTTPDIAPPEIGGRGGLDPTRYGDWEKNGRCIDF